MGVGAEPVPLTRMTVVATDDLGSTEQAASWLAKAGETGFPCYPWFERDPAFRSGRITAELLDRVREDWRRLRPLVNWVADSTG